MREIVRHLFGLVLTIVIVHEFGWLGLLASLPFILALSFAWEAVKVRWARRGALK